MGILIGMDEAGYGPNLGPLVVAATAWEAPEEGSGFGVQDAGDGNGATANNRGMSRPLSDGAAVLAPVAKGVRGGKAAVARRRSDEIDLYRLLRPVVARSISERRIAIADSKALYRPGQGLRQLERGLHAVFLAMSQSHACWSAIVRNCSADPNGHERQLPWHEGFDCALPFDAKPEELTRLGARMAKVCDGAGVRPVCIRARLVFPAEFNELVDHYQSKGAALSHVTVGLLREVMEALNLPAGADSARPATAGKLRSPAVPSPTYVVCDKHGGRNYYTALLQHHFSEHWIEPVLESHAESRYEWGPSEARVRATFRVGGESFLPTALASMTAKYLRELAMRAWNEFWCTRIKELRPTAGYYNDSWRFKKAIAATQRELGIEDRIVWRNR